MPIRESLLSAPPTSNRGAGTTLIATLALVCMKPPRRSHQEKEKRKGECASLRERAKRGGIKTWDGCLVTRVEEGKKRENKWEFGRHNENGGLYKVLLECFFFFYWVRALDFQEAFPPPCLFIYHLELPPFEFQTWKAQQCGSLALTIKGCLDLNQTWPTLLSIIDS